MSNAVREKAILKLTFETWSSCQKKQTHDRCPSSGYMMTAVPNMPDNTSAILNCFQDTWRAETLTNGPKEPCKVKLENMSNRYGFPGSKSRLTGG